MDARAAHDFFSSHGIDARRADPEVLNAAYRALAKKLHPDRGGSSETMKDLNRAYDVLKAAINNGSYAAEQERQRQEHAERERQAREQAAKEQEARRQAEKERRDRAERERAEKERREHAERERAEAKRKEQERAERERRLAEQRQKMEREQAEQELAAKERQQQDKALSEDPYLSVWSKKLSAGIAEARSKNDERISWQTESAEEPKEYDKTRLFLALVIILTMLPIVGVFFLAKEKTSLPAAPPSTPESRWTDLEAPSDAVVPATIKLRRMEHASEIECRLKYKEGNLRILRLIRRSNYFVENLITENGTTPIHAESEKHVLFPSVFGEWLNLKYNGSWQNETFSIVVPNSDLPSGGATVGASLTSKNDATSAGRELASGSCRATL
jgi:curved DNA-binding protein CbpA